MQNWLPKLYFILFSTTIMSLFADGVSEICKKKRYTYNSFYQFHLLIYLLSL